MYAHQMMVGLYIYSNQLDEEEPEEEESILPEDSMISDSMNSTLNSLDPQQKRPKKYLKLRKKKKVNVNKSYQKLAKEKKKKRELINESRQNLSSFITKSMIDAPSKPKPNVSFTDEFRNTLDKKILSNTYHM